MITTYQQIKSQSNSILRRIPLGVGVKKEKSDVSGQIIQEEYITPMIYPKFLVQQNQSKKETSSVMQESVVTIKKKTLTDKLNFSNQNTPNPLSSRTLVLESIGKDQDLTPFWNQRTMEISRQLWLPTKTDLVDSDLNLSNGFLKNQILNSWFSITLQKNKIQQTNLQRTYLQSLQSLLPEIMDLEQENTEKKEKQLKTVKPIKTTKVTNLKPKKIPLTPKEDACRATNVRVYFNSNQRQLLNKWFGARRWIYNKCLTLFKIDSKTTITSYREKIINNKNFETENTWMLEYNYDLRDEALRDLLKNIKSNKAKYDNSGVKFDIKYKSKKMEKQKGTSLSVLAKHWNKKNNFYAGIFNREKMSLYKKEREKQLIPIDLQYTSRLKLTPTKKYYFCIPKPLKMERDNQAHTKMIFFDPGSVTFLSGYNPVGEIIEIGKHDSSRIGRLLHYKSKLQSKKANKKIKAKQRRRYNIAMLKIGENIRNLVTDMHRKIAKWLCYNYSHIYIPRLNFHTMKNLNKKAKARLAAYRHCEFVDLLKNKSKQFENCHVLEVNEANSSIGCCGCGYQNKKLGKKRVFKCEKCNITLGRDINAPTNIMLRYFTKRAIIQHV